MIALRRITGESMVPSLPPGRVVVGIRLNRFLWRLGWVKAGMVVLFHHDGLDKVKRVTKLQGDQVYVVGDNSAASTDSRHFGWLDKDTVRAVIVWPILPLKVVDE